MMDSNKINLTKNNILTELLDDEFLEQLEDKYNPLENDHVLDPMVIDSIAYLHQQGHRSSIDPKAVSQYLSSHFVI